MGYWQCSELSCPLSVRIALNAQSGNERQTLCQDLLTDPNPAHLTLLISGLSHRGGHWSGLLSLATVGLCLLLLSCARDYEAGDSPLGDTVRVERNKIIVSLPSSKSKVEMVMPYGAEVESQLAPRYDLFTVVYDDKTNSIHGWVQDISDNPSAWQNFIARDYLRLFLEADERQTGQKIDTIFIKSVRGATGQTMDIYKLVQGGKERYVGIGMAANLLVRFETVRNLQGMADLAQSIRLHRD